MHVHFCALVLFTFFDVLEWLNSRQVLWISARTSMYLGLSSWSFGSVYISESSQESRGSWSLIRELGRTTLPKCFFLTSEFLLVLFFFCNIFWFVLILLISMNIATTRIIVPAPSIVIAINRAWTSLSMLETGGADVSLVSLCVVSRIIVTMWYLSLLSPSSGRAVPLLLMLIL